MERAPSLGNVRSKAPEPLFRNGETLKNRTLKTTVPVNCPIGAHRDNKPSMIGFPGI